MAECKQSRVQSVQDEASIQGYFTIMKDQIIQGDQVSSNAFLEKEEVLSRMKQSGAGAGKGRIGCLLVSVKELEYNMNVAAGQAELFLQYDGQQAA